MKHFKWKKYH